MLDRNVKARILVVDDQPEIIETIRQFFEARACSDQGAGTVEGALAAAETGNFDVIFLDVVLPGMGGLSAIGELKRRCGAEIMMITGQRDENIATDAALLGARQLFHKPLYFPDLERAVLDVVGARAHARFLKK